MSNVMDLKWTSDIMSLKLFIFTKLINYYLLHFATLRKMPKKVYSFSSLSESTCSGESAIPAINERTLSENNIANIGESDFLRLTKKKVRKNFFPYKLMQIITSPDFSDCISWENEGKAFFIANLDKLVEKYATIYEKKSTTKKESFTRKLNRWGFKVESTKGPNCGLYFNEFFQRDKPWLCELMVCRRCNATPKTETNGHEEIFELQNNKRQFLGEQGLYSPSDENVLPMINMDKRQRLLDPREATEEIYKSHWDLNAREAPIRFEHPRIPPPAVPQRRSGAFADVHNTIVYNAILALVQESNRAQCF